MHGCDLIVLIKLGTYYLNTYNIPPIPRTSYSRQSATSTAGKQAPEMNSPTGSSKCRRNVAGMGGNRPVVFAACVLYFDNGFIMI